MASDADMTHLGLPWPEAYAGLKPVLCDDWGVAGEIYLHHQLSGKSGALVYAADLDSKKYSGQAILKFDRPPNPEWQEKTEAERHELAFRTAPDFAAVHLPHLLSALHHGEGLATLSSIAGRGLEYVKPWAECAHDSQLSILKRLSRDLLEDWNADAGLAEGLLLPQELLQGWLDYRLDPKEGRLHNFLDAQCGLSPVAAGLFFEGHWYPNPLLFAREGVETGGGQRLRAMVGNSHGDLHGFNVLVDTRSGDSDSYYLIDLAFYQDRQFLFFDHAYLELSHLLMARERADAANWQSILDHLSPFDHIGETGQLRGDDLGLFELVFAIRGEAAAWTDRHQAGRLAYMESQYLLARVAAGLNFASKRLDDKARRMAFLYAAANLKDYLKRNGVDWPKQGAPFELTAAEAPAAPLPTPPPDGSGASKEALEAAALYHDSGHPPLPEKPAIAVLAFENLSGDSAQDYFSDGVAEELITALSRVDWLMVVARASSFAYKGQNVDVKRIGQELGVHYVVAGSVRRAGSRARVSVQLIDAWNSHHLWAERFDRDIADVIALQDDIAETIAANLDSNLRVAERERVRHATSQMSLWERFQDAMWHYFKFSAEHDDVAADRLRSLIDEVPSFASAHAMLALVDCRRITCCETDRVEADLDSAEDHARQAIAADEKNSLARVAFCRVLALRGKYDRAVDQGERALALNPSSAVANAALAGALLWRGDGAAAIAEIDKAIHMNSQGPFRDLKLTVKAICLYMTGSVDAAASLARQVLYARQAGPIAFLIQALAQAQRGQGDEAAATLAELKRTRPDFSLARLQTCWRTLAPAYLEKLVQDLRTAGFEE